MSNLKDCDIAIASDHAAFDVKQHVVKALLKMGYSVYDMGPRNRRSADYPVYGKKVAKSVSTGEVPLGVLICGTGIGMSITANRFPNVRAALVHDLYTTLMAKRHNNANVLVFGGRIIAKEMAEFLVKTWLEEEYEGGRHQKRLDMIDGEC